MVWSSSERDAEIDGDDGGRRDVFGDVPVLRVKRVPADHFGIEHPELPVDPLEVVLNRDGKRGRGGATDGPANGDGERDVAQFEEVLREPHDARVAGPSKGQRQALKSLPGGQAVRVPRGQERVGPRAGRPANRPQQRLGRRPVIDPRPALRLAPRGQGVAFGEPQVGRLTIAPLTANSIPALDILPTLKFWLAGKPSEGTWRTGKRASVVNRWYQVNSRVRRLRNNAASKPSSASRVRSGPTSGLPMVPGRKQD